MPKRVIPCSKSGQQVSGSSLPTFSQHHRPSALCASVLVALALSNVAMAQQALPESTSGEVSPPSSQDGTAPTVDQAKKQKKVSPDGKTKKPAFENTAMDAMTEDVGPFFGFSTFNGRELSGTTNTRDFSFNQFPAELFKRTDQGRFYGADQVEGALWGMTSTEAIKPLDLKKRRIWAELRGIYSSYADRSGQGPGKRGSASYVDQFETGIGRIGISAGVMASNSFLPKDFYKGSTNTRPCNSTAATTPGNCTYDPNSSDPTYYPTGPHTFRQQRSDERQRAYFLSLQWQPNEKWDITLDAQHSNRLQSRYRSEFSLTEGYRSLTPLEISPHGAPLLLSGESALESLSFARTRDETYKGLGLNVQFRPSDRVLITTDVSYLDTQRLQTDISASMTSNEIFGPGGRVGYLLDYTGGTGVPSVQWASPIDLDNYDAYTGSGAARRGRDTRRDTIKAWRTDLRYNRDGLFDSLQVGVRYSEHERSGSLLTYLRGSIDQDTILAGNANCRRGPITTDFLEESGSNINSWAVFDPACLYATFSGSTNFDLPLDTITGGEQDISEKILAGYAMGNFKTDIVGLPLRGNVGTRLTQTRRHTRVVRYTGDGQPIEDDSGSIFDVLPSADAVLETGRRSELEFSVYRTLLRSAIDGFNLRRVIAGPSGTMERQDPVKAWNVDMAWRFAPRPDTALSAGLFYKSLSSSAWPGDLIIPGGPVPNPALRDDTRKESYIRGYSVSASHQFSYLPAPLDGLTLEGSYAHSSTNFRYQDPSASDPNNPLYLFVSPVGIPGLSKEVGILTARYEKAGFGAGATYDYRSGYSRPTGLTANRVLAPTHYVNAYLSYQFNEYLQMRLSGVNLTKEHETLYRPVEDAAAQTSYLGRTYQLSLRLRF